MLIFVDIVEKDIVYVNKLKNIRKIENNIVEISTRLKIRNLTKFRFENLFKSKKAQSMNITKEFKFLTFNIRVFFIKLK